MRLPFLRSKDPATERARKTATAPGADLSLEAARTKARQRLVGALVLLVAGVIGFPILFETQPRPLPMDTPMQVQRPEVLSGVQPVTSERPPQAALSPPDAGIEAGAAAAAGAPPPAGPTTGQPPGTGTDAGKSTTAVAAEAAAPGPSAAPPAPTAAATLPPQATVPPATPPPSEKAAPSDDGGRARQLLENKSALPAAASGRFVVQAGAYADASSLRAARQRVEKLGLKTYTQVIDSSAGQRTRVRVGPFASREEAQAAADRIKAAGLQAAVLSL